MQCSLGGLPLGGGGGGGSFFLTCLGISTRSLDSTLGANLIILVRLGGQTPL